MDRQHIESVVQTVITALLKCPIGAHSARANTPQWDSLKHIEVIFAIEDELHLQFDEAHLASLDSVSKIVDMALARHAA